MVSACHREVIYSWSWLSAFSPWNAAESALCAVCRGTSFSSSSIKCKEKEGKYMGKVMKSHKPHLESCSLLYLHFRRRFPHFRLWLVFQKVSHKSPHNLVSVSVVTWNFCRREAWQSFFRIPIFRLVKFEGGCVGIFLRLGGPYFFHPPNQIKIFEAMTECLRGPFCIPIGNTH